MKYDLPFVRRLGMGLAAALALLTQPLGAQGVQRIDPNSAIDANLAPVDELYEPYAPPAQSFPVEQQPAPYEAPPVVTSTDPATAAGQAAAQPELAAAQGDTYKQDDLIGAAEGLFGKGAEGLARLIEDVLKDQGEPNGYIVGREAGAAFVVGARYGSGTLFHKVEGQMPVYWTGPSVGFDAGANAGNTFILVYNLYDTDQLYERYPAAEGQLYAVGGMNASYLRKDGVVLIPIRVGAGLRLGVNAGYMKFSEKQNWIPF